MLTEGYDSPYLLSFLVDFYEEELEKLGNIEVSTKRSIQVKTYIWYFNIVPLLLFLSSFLEIT